MSWPSVMQWLRANRWPALSSVLFLLIGIGACVVKLRVAPERELRLVASEMRIEHLRARKGHLLPQMDLDVVMAITRVTIKHDAEARLVGPSGSCALVREDKRELKGPSPLFGTRGTIDLAIVPDATTTTSLGVTTVLRPQDPADGHRVITVYPTDHDPVETELTFDHTVDPAQLSGIACADGRTIAARKLAFTSNELTEIDIELTWPVPSGAPPLFALDTVAGGLSATTLARTTNGGQPRVDSEASKGTTEIQGELALTGITITRDGLLADVVPSRSATITLDGRGTHDWERLNFEWIALWLGTGVALLSLWKTVLDLRKHYADKSPAPSPSESAPKV